MSLTSADAILFFEEIAAIPTQSGRIVPPAPWGDQTAFGYLWKAAHRQGQPIAEAERWWNEATNRLTRRFPNADRLALEWLCDIDARHGQLLRIRGAQWANSYALDSSHAWLQLWVLRRPTDDGPARIEAALWDAIPAAIGAAQPQQPLSWLNTRALEQLAEFLPSVCAGDGFLDRARRLLGRAMAAQPSGPAGGFVRDAFLRAFAVPLWEAGRLTPEEQTETILCSPALVSLLDRLETPVLVQDHLRGIVTDLLARVVREGAIDSRTQGVLFAYHRYTGFADFAAAVRCLDRAPDLQRVIWAPRLLQRLPPPGPEDCDRLPELADVRPETFFIAGVFAPAWAVALRGAGLGEETAALAALAHWAARFLRPSPWSQDHEGRRLADWDAAAVIGERASLREALATIGVARARKLIKHPLIRNHARIAGFCLSAVLGENAAEIDAKFLKRDKWAVVALGMLPDEGDVADRYLALRRFAREAQKSGPQRAVSEAVAVEAALAHLAATGGYESVDALAWAIETQLAAAVDPTAKRWSVGDYDVWIEPDDGAAIRVARGGKARKTVPAAVRKTPEYEEAKEARDALLAQTDRVRRRLERAMVAGEVLDRAAYDQLLALPAGRLYLPRLVLTVRLSGGDAPIEMLDGRMLDGEPVALDGLAGVQVAHPLHLAGVGTLAVWQRRLVEAGIAQPINQLFRGVYRATEGERTDQACRRFQGRRVKLGNLRRALLKAGWEAPSYYVGFVRRFDPPAVVELVLEDSVTIGRGDEVVALGKLEVRGHHGRLSAFDPLRFAEAVRDVDLAMAHAMADSLGSGVVSPEQRAVRAQLVQALVPAATIDGDLVSLPGGAVHLATGAAFDAAGRALVLSDRSGPVALPFPDPDPTTATLAATALTLATAGP